LGGRWARGGNRWPSCRCNRAGCANCACRGQSARLVSGARLSFGCARRRRVGACESHCVCAQVRGGGGGGGGKSWRRPSEFWRPTGELSLRPPRCSEPAAAIVRDARSHRPERASGPNKGRQQRLSAGGEPLARPPLNGPRRRLPAPAASSSSRLPLPLLLPQLPLPLPQLPPPPPPPHPSGRRGFGEPIRPLFWLDPYGLWWQLGR